ncbi:hypothetical protein ACO0K2_17680 [Undibacterium sp. MH2W]|uniref:hypothetical protein n=1 Tax=Undibacterium sp. MH2W TaxID=3413044 RepID=UPI003BF10430
MKFYSKSARGFFDSDVHGKVIPEDAVEITDEEHQSLLAGQASGKTIGHEETGKPILIDPKPMTDAQIKDRDNAKVIAQIKALELGSHRALREALLGIGAEKLKQIDDQIVDLRKQIK